MKTLFLSIIVFSVSILLIGTSNQVFAPCLVGVTSCGPPPGVTVVATTDSQFYEKNDTITVQGQVYLENYTKPVTIQVVNPNNTTIQSIDVPVNNETFGTKITANFTKTGMYQIVTCVQNWCNRSYIKFVSEPYRLTAGSTDFLINYKSFADLVGMEADVNSQALRVHITNATAQGLQFVITLPRELIDSRGYDGNDASFRVWIGMHQPDKYMAPANFTQITSNGKSRTLAIDIPYEPVSNSNGIWDFKIMSADVASGPGVSNESPLKLFRLGMTIDQIHCQKDFVLIIKSEDGSPACTSSETAQILIQRGWGHALDTGVSVTLREGQRDGPLLVQKVLQDSIQGLNFREYPLATNVGMPVTLHIGDTASNGCTVELTLVKINNDTATFLKKEYHNKPCPICLSEDTVIDTPNGRVNIKDLKVGMSVFTQDDSGKKQIVTISKTGKTLTLPGHKMVHLILDDNRELYVSQNHPTADGRLFGKLALGDIIDGSKIKSTELVSYNGTYTYDILPSGGTGFYWANGILAGSTLK
jgi:hypothetical protein